MALEAHYKGGKTLSSPQRLVKTLKEQYMYEDVCREAHLIDESVQAGDTDQLERFGSILDTTLQRVQEM